MKIELKKRQKGKDKLLHKNYLYIQDRKSEEPEYWKYVECKKFKCRARIISTNTSIQKESGSHSHPADVTKNKSGKYNQRLEK